MEPDDQTAARSTEPPVDTVVLDVDGTLVDSNYQHVAAWARAFREVGISVPNWRLHRAIGMGADRLVAHVAGDAAEAGAGDAVRAVHAAEFTALAATVQLLPGADRLIGELHRRGLTVVLASSGSAEDVERMLDLVPDAHLAEAVVTGSDVEETKPGTELLEVAVDRADGRRAAAIGDSVWDMLAAVRLGAVPLAVLTGGVGPEELREAGAQQVFESPAALLDGIDRTPLAGAAG